MAAVATALACGCRPDVGEDAVPRIRSVAVSHPVAYSASETMAVLDDGGVCLLDTYSVRILCGDARWSVVTEIGREGKGPGEISGTGELLPIPGGGLAYVDNRNRRIAIYSAALEFSHDVAKEEMGPPIPPIAEDSVLYVMQTSFARTERTINRYSLGEREPPPPIRLVLDASAIGLDSIAAAPILRTDDSFLLRATGDNLILMAADGDRVLGVIPTPTFDPGHPDSLDIEEIRSDLRHIFGVVIERDVEAVASRPRNHYPRGAIAQLDRHGHVWVLTNRRAANGTYFHVYAGVRPIASVQLAARVLAFRIRGDTLIALTTSPQLDEAGLRPRRLELFPIGGGH